MMPEYLPMHLELVYLSGIIEVALGVMLLVPRTQSLAAIGIIILLIAVFPANLYMYQNPSKFPDMSETALLIRMPIQLLLILWAASYRKSRTS